MFLVPFLVLIAHASAAAPTTTAATATTTPTTSTTITTTTATTTTTTFVTECDKGKKFVPKSDTGPAKCQNCTAGTFNAYDDATMECLEHKVCEDSEVKTPGNEMQDTVCKTGM